MLKGHLQWITWLSWQPLHRYIICGSRICLYHPKLNFQRGWRGSKQNTSLNGLENNKGWILFVLFFFSNPDCRFLASASKVSALFFNYHKILVMSPHLYKRPHSSPPCSNRLQLYLISKTFLCITVICHDYEKVPHNELCVSCICFLDCEFKSLKKPFKVTINLRGCP